MDLSKLQESTAYAKMRYWLRQSDRRALKRMPHLQKFKDTVIVTPVEETLADTILESFKALEYVPSFYDDEDDDSYLDKYGLDPSQYISSDEKKPEKTQDRLIRKMQKRSAKQDRVERAKAKEAEKREEMAEDPAVSIKYI